MPAREAVAWEEYLDRHPQGIDQVQQLLAQLTHFFYSAHSGKDTPKKDIFDFAPQLEERKARMKRLALWKAQAEEADRIQRQMRKTAMEEAWDRTKEKRDRGELPD